MTRLEAALIDIASFMDEHGIPYMIVGGFANLHWGVERFTRDLDLAVDVEKGGLERLVNQLALAFRIDAGRALAFAERNHLIRFETKNGVPVDLMIAVLPYEQAAIGRAVGVPLGKRTVRMCAAEDLIVYKLASERLQDAADVEGVVLRQAQRLDRPYLAARVQELAAGLERPQIVDFLDQLLRRADSIQKEERRG